MGRAGRAASPMNVSALIAWSRTCQDCEGAHKAFKEMTPEDLKEKAQLTPEVLKSYTPVEPPMREGDSGKDVHGKGEFRDPDDDGTQSRQTLPPACVGCVPH